MNHAINKHEQWWLSPANANNRVRSEMMMVLQMEVSKRYTPGEHDRIAAMPKPPKLKDTKLD